MIHSTKKDQYWSFWCQVCSNHQDQEFFWGNRASEASKAGEVVEAAEINEAAEVSKVLKMITENFRVIQVLEFYNLRTNTTLFWCFEKKKKLTKSWKIMLNFINFSVGGCWGQPILLFWKLVGETQMSEPQDVKTTFKLNTICLFLSIRHKLLLSVHSETPCNCV